MLQIPSIESFPIIPIPEIPEIMETIEPELEKLKSELEDLAQNSKQEKRLWGDYISEDIDIEIPANTGMSVNIEHKFGNVDVRTGTNYQITIKGEKRVSDRDKELAREFLDKMELKIEERGNTIEIKTYYPDEIDRKKIKNFSISYKIEIPEETDLNIENSFGNIDLREVSGKFTISNGFGKLYAEDLTGETLLKNKFGELKAENIKGETNITNSHGSINITDITGNTTASNKFGKINVNNVKGKAVVTGGHGEITVDDISLEAELKNSYGSIKCSNIGGEAEINNSHGKVEVQYINGNTNIRNKFGTVDAENIDGDLYVENSHSPVKAKRISGNITVDNSFSPVTVTNSDGNVIVSNNHGNITVKNILKKESVNERLVDLETSFGVIRLDLPDNISAELEASTTFGKIKCDFPVYLESTSSNALKISAKLGDTKDKIEIKGKNTSIYINSETTIMYKLPKKSSVRLTIYNIQGQEVKTLLDEIKPAGYHTIKWDRTNDNGIEVNSGVYFCKVQAGDYIEVKKVELME
ncbi:FlgD immunoglobulin-like domain containing protein [candidate division KSB1 bacterium]